VPILSDQDNVLIGNTLIFKKTRIKNTVATATRKLEQNLFRPCLKKKKKTIDAVCLAYVCWARWPRTSGGESGNQLGL
jgi:hypothetical protein